MQGRTHPPGRLRLCARCAETNFPAGINQGQQATPLCHQWTDFVLLGLINTCCNRNVPTSSTILFSSSSTPIPLPLRLLREESASCCLPLLARNTGEGGSHGMERSRSAGGTAHRLDRRCQSVLQLTWTNKIPIVRRSWAIEPKAPRNLGSATSSEYAVETRRKAPPAKPVRIRPMSRGEKEG